MQTYGLREIAAEGGLQYFQLWEPIRAGKIPGIAWENCRHGCIGRRFTAGERQTILDWIAAEKAKLPVFSLTEISRQAGVPYTNLFYWLRVGKIPGIEWRYTNSGSRGMKFSQAQRDTIFNWIVSTGRQKKFGNKNVS